MEAGRKITGKQQRILIVDDEGEMTLNKNRFITTMLQDEDKTKEQLISELAVLRQQATELAALEIERNLAQDALVESEAKFRILAEQSPNMIFIIKDEKGGILYANKRCEKIMRYKRKELYSPSFNFFTLLAPEHGYLAKTSFSKHMRGEEVPALEYALLTKDGKRTDVILSTALIQYDGKTALIGTATDITERRRAERALREGEKKYRELADLLPQIVFETDDKGNITFWNRQTFKASGYTLEDFDKGVNVLQLVIPEERDKVRENIERVLAEGKPGSTEHTALRKDGSTFPIIIYSAPIIRDNKPVGLRGIIIDITEHKQMEDRAKQLQQELYFSSRIASIGELAAGVAHEINNPLTGIQGFSERLLRKSTDEKTRQYLERIHSEARRAASVVSNLLTFARRKEPKKECVDINDVLRRAMELRIYELKTSNIEVELDLTPGLPLVVADFQQMQEVFLNIILNAEQAMTEANRGGKLVIKTQEQEGHIRITFADGGPGIPHENLSKLFDPFFSTRGEKGGTGLGLSICYGIVTGHGGKIYAKSKLGKGATFVVELPISDNS